jgi:hypothetical protein
MFGNLGSFYVSFLYAERVGELEKRLREDRGGNDDNERLGRETVRLSCSFLILPSLHLQKMLPS